jgi:hypothetical protein
MLAWASEITPNAYSSASKVRKSDCGFWVSEDTYIRQEREVTDKYYRTQRKLQKEKY